MLHQELQGIGQVSQHLSLVISRAEQHVSIHSDEKGESDNFHEQTIIYSFWEYSNMHLLGYLGGGEGTCQKSRLPDQLCSQPSNPGYAAGFDYVCSSYSLFLFDFHWHFTSCTYGCTKMAVTEFRGSYFPTRKSTVLYSSWSTDVSFVINRSRRIAPHPVTICRWMRPSPESVACRAAAAESALNLSWRSRSRGRAASQPGAVAPRRDCYDPLPGRPASQLCTWTLLKLSRVAGALAAGARKLPPHGSGAATY